MDNGFWETPIDQRVQKDSIYVKLKNANNRQDKNGIIELLNSNVDINMTGTTGYKKL